MKPLTKEWALTFKPAVEELLKRYRGKNKRGDFHCPLCKLCDFGKYSRDCSICPWLVLEGYKCESEADHYYHQSYPTRIKRLTRWLDKINEILEVE